MRHRGLETSIYFPFGILLTINAVFCPSVKDTLLTNIVYVQTPAPS